MSVARPMLGSSLLSAAAAALSLSAVLATPAAAQTVFHACYVPASGTVYRIKATNTPQNCLQPTHVAFSWTDGVDAAAALQNAVKKTDIAAGDVTGVFSSLTVGKLLGRALAATPPTEGQVLAWNATNSAWEPKTVVVGGGGGGVSDHGALTGLSDDDHAQYALTSGVRSTTGFALTGTSQIFPLPVSGGGTRFMWIPQRGALRAGAVPSTEWDLSLLGMNSVATGYNTVASGERSSAFGSLARATGSLSFAVGTNPNVATTASGQSSVAIGSASSATGAFSFAIGTGVTASAPSAFGLGRSASAEHQGSIVLNASLIGVSSTVANQFVVRADRMWLGSNSNVAATAGRFLETSTGAYLTTGGAWTNSSDSTVKTAFSPVDGDAVLAKIAALPIYTWQYKSEDSTTRHMGPTAQAFRKAFGLGDTEKAIATVDIDGVAVAGVKALETRTRALNMEIVALREENADLASRLAQLEALVAQLAAAPRSR